jgi:hypothetical protein
MNFQWSSSCAESNTNLLLCAMYKPKHNCFYCVHVFCVVPSTQLHYSTEQYNVKAFLELFFYKVCLCSAYIHNTFNWAFSVALQFTFFHSNALYWVSCVEKIYCSVRNSQFFILFIRSKVKAILTAFLSVESAMQ